MPTGYIQGVQTITGHIMQTGMKGNIKDSDRISGIVSQTQRLTGTIKNLSHVHGIISKPSPNGKSDHVFVIVDLLKLYAANTNVITANAAMPITATNTQVSDDHAAMPITATNTQISSGNANINLTATTVTVNQMIAVVTDE